MLKKENSNKKRQKKHLRIRKTVNGTPERPRLNVYRSLNNIYAQIIDDNAGRTLVSASTLDKDIKEKLEATGNRGAAKIIGKIVAERALAQGIDRVIFDRGGYIYHGRVQELADGAREGGLKF